MQLRWQVTSQFLFLVQTRIKCFLRPSSFHIDVWYSKYLSLEILLGQHVLGLGFQLAICQSIQWKPVCTCHSNHFTWIGEVFWNGKEVHVNKSIFIAVAKFSSPFKRCLPATLWSGVVGPEVHWCSLARIEFSYGFRNYKIISVENQGATHAYLLPEIGLFWNRPHGGNLM